MAALDPLNEDDATGSALDALAEKPPVDLNDVNSRKEVFNRAVQRILDARNAIQVPITQSPLSAFGSGMLGDGSIAQAFGRGMDMQTQAEAAQQTAQQQAMTQRSGLDLRADMARILGDGGPNSLQDAAMLGAIGGDDKAGDALAKLQMYDTRAQGSGGATQAVQQGKDGKWYKIDKTNGTVTPVDVGGKSSSGVNRDGMEIGTTPEGSSVPVFGDDQNPYADAPPTQAAIARRGWEKTLAEDDAVAKSNMDAITRLNAVKDTVHDTYTGGFTNLPGVRGIVDAFSTPRQEINALNKELALSPGERPKGMRLTQGEVFMLRQAVPGNDKSEEANKNIADAAIGIRQRPIDWVTFKRDFMDTNGFWDEAKGERMFDQYVKENPVFDPNATPKDFKLNTNRVSLQDYAKSGGFDNFVGKRKSNPIASSDDSTPKSGGAPDYSHLWGGKK